MKFKADIKLHFADFLKWTKLYARSSDKKSVTAIIVSKLLLTALLVLVLAVGAAMIFHGSVDAATIIALLIFIAIPAFFLLKDIIAAKASLNRYLKDAGSEQVSFFDEALYSKSEKGEIIYSYSSMTAIYTDGERFFLMFGDRGGFVMPKRCINVGDPESFAAFISERTGLKVFKVSALCTPTDIPV